MARAIAIIRLKNNIVESEVIWRRDGVNSTAQIVIDGIKMNCTIVVVKCCGGAYIKNCTVGTINWGGECHFKCRQSAIKGASGNIKIPRSLYKVKSDIRIAAVKSSRRLRPTIGADCDGD